MSKRIKTSKPYLDASHWRYARSTQKCCCRRDRATRSSSHYQDGKLHHGNVILEQRANSHCAPFTKVPHQRSLHISQSYYVLSATDSPLYLRCFFFDFQKRQTRESTILRKIYYPPISWLPKIRHNAPFNQPARLTLMLERGCEGQGTSSSDLLLQPPCPRALLIRVTGATPGT